ncbi:MULTISPECIES: HoxN/HupN/NixA family nickel/cobalt transporter [unclassified Bradyrhizobium]|uniref:HoxN/HupN/NixA family nickel/cobalt transporter n=1 Tax=unclassified Bradyrhizobium TaxID=2631580 RepID=UPI00291642A4|nr:MULTISPECIES: HoxN/HupN/NixA family nickel/cobalt transporter [unclassified Bradyrhizobium]
MILPIRHTFDDRPQNQTRKIVLIYAALITTNVAAWTWALVQYAGQPVLLGMASLAYSFGLRHAVDPDHIAAIDNVTRKLMQEEKRPISTGLFFALGHSTVVIIASLLVACSIAALDAKFSWFKEIGGLVGIGVSAAFLIVIALANLVILLSIYRAFSATRRGQQVTDDALNDLLLRRGPISRTLRSLFAIVTKSWHMYPLGFLFGLGFDTATEVSLLGLSATQASSGLPVWSTLVLPALFTAGMSLVDTTDGVVMVQAYGWAFTNPIRKLYYNLTMTSISVVVALLIGGIELISLVADKWDLHGGGWSLVDQISQHFGIMGYFIIGIFVIGWLMSVLIFRLGHLDQTA